MDKFKYKKCCFPVWVPQTIYCWGPDRNGEECMCPQFDNEHGCKCSLGYPLPKDWMYPVTKAEECYNQLFHEIEE